MKTLVKLINVHDGNACEKQNGERLYIETYPRAEKIISAFLTNGWKLASQTPRYNPSILQDGNFAFYLGGWDFLFEKVVEDDAEDDSDKILEEVLNEVVDREVPSYFPDDFIYGDDVDEDDEFEIPDDEEF